MKRALLLMGIGCISLIFLSACTSKKDRLTSDTMSITVDPSAEQTVATGGTVQLQALARNATSDNVDVNPIWSVENGLGTFNPPQGKTTTFTAAKNTGSGKIYASYGEVRGCIGVVVTDSKQSGGGGNNSGGGGSGNTGNAYGLLSETFIKPRLLFDVPNPPNADGGCLGSWAGGQGKPLPELMDATGSGEKTEGLKSLKCTIGPTLGGGWWVQFGSDNISGFNDLEPIAFKDMSAFSGGSLKFDIKTPDDILVKVEWAGGSWAILLSTLGVSRDNKWHSVSIPLSEFKGIDLKKIEKPAGFHASNPNFSYYVDNVRWDK